MHLLAPLMLTGVLLASVPIIIHLLNRRRFQIIEWAPMKYLRLTLKTNRRRMRIEQLLLLIVRTLVVALLFVALARPAMSRGLLGSWLASSARTSRVIVIDDSLSTGYQVDHRSAFDTAKEAAAQLVRNIGVQDSVTMLLTSELDAPLVREATIDNPAKLLQQIGALTPADATCEWPEVFKRVDDLLAGAAHPQRELVLITDLRGQGWSGNLIDFTTRWASQQSLEVKVFDVGARATDNVVLARFEQDDPIALPGSPLKLHASIRNDTPSPIRGTQATLAIDDQSRPLVLPDLPAGQTIELPLSVTFDKPGQHELRLALPAVDALLADNQRWLNIDVRSKIEIALIDGQIGGGPFESSTDFLQVAFTAGADPWQVTRRGEGEPQKLAVATDVIVLSNIASLSPQQVGELERLVAAGTGLLIFPGELVDPVVYDQRLYRNGAGLLPARFDRTIDEPAAGLVVEGLDDSPLAPLTKIAPEALARVRPKRFMSVAFPSPRPATNHGEQPVRILARWNDAEAHPAVIEKRFGRGRVLMFTVSADRQWSDWPVDPTYVLAMRSAALAAARRDPASENFTAGEPIALQLDDGQSARNPRIVEPDQTSPLSMNGDATTLRFSPTPHAGKYLLSWNDAAGGERSRQLCASFDPRESNLEPIGDAELMRRFAPLAPTIVHWTGGGGEPLTDAGREIWRTLIVTVLALAAFETALAVWVGRER